MDNKATNNTAHAVAKVFLYICATTVGVIWLYSSKLDPETIEVCREACSSLNTIMESATSTECICASNFSANGWVLPR